MNFEIVEEETRIRLVKIMLKVARIFIKSPRRHVSL